MFLIFNKVFFCRLCCFCYLLGLSIFLSGLISPTVISLKTNPMEVLLNECPLAVHKELCTLQKCHSEEHYFTHRDRIVIIVIDALRADFISSVKKGHVFNFTMNFTESLLNNGKAISFITEGFAPTVTLPRIKTLVTGTISNFIDVIINFNAVKLTSDNVLRQANLHGLKSIFYGDDTWIKLFPNTFLRSEGIHSFFVSDFTEVDLNVSRHIDSELMNDDWNIMVLHFLGVDHIGHAYSPFSKHLSKKLLEMDEIIHFVYANLKHNKSPPLIILCGDHGMTTAGSHGGITKDELLTPLIFIDTAINNTSALTSLDIINQVDFAPTLSVILGIPIPVSNFGSIIPAVLEFVGFSREEILFAAYYNFLQLYNMYEKTFKKQYNINLITELTLNHFNLLKSNNEYSSFTDDIQYKYVLKSYHKVLNEIKLELLSNISGYNKYSMMVGIIIMWICVIFLLFILYPLSTNKTAILKRCSQNMLKYCSFIFIFLIIYFLIYKHFFKVIVAVLCIILLLALYSTFVLLKSVIAIHLGKKIEKICLFFLLLHALSLFSSSFIEEEHQTWYFLSVTIALLIFIKRHQNFLNMKFKQTGCKRFYQFKWLWEGASSDLYFIIAFLILHRISRKWNQVGNKWQHLPDVSDWLNEKNHGMFLLLLIVFSQIAILKYFKVFLSQFNYILFLAGTICQIFRNFELLYGNLVMPSFITFTLIPWIVYLDIAVMFVMTFIKLYSYAYTSNTEKALHIIVNIISQWILLVGIIGRPHNFPLIATTLIQEYVLSKMVWTKDCDKVTSTVCYFAMAKTSYFYYGNSNSISTLDVFTGYTGIQSYMPAFVAILLTCNTYSTFIIWLLMLIYRILKLYRCDNYEHISQRVRYRFLFLLYYKFFILALYCMVVYIMRYHLFIHSVFFPKLFYEICFVLCFLSLYLLICFTIPGM